MFRLVSDTLASPYPPVGAHRRAGVPGARENGAR